MEDHLMARPQTAHRSDQTAPAPASVASTPDRGTAITPGAFVLRRHIATTQHTDFVHWCEQVHAAGTIGVATGPPGVGKTWSAEQFTRWREIRPLQGSYLTYDARPGEFTGCDAILYRAEVIHTPQQAESEIRRARLTLSHLVAASERAGYSVQTPILTLPPDCTRLIIVDEAELLMQRSLEQVRAISDRDDGALTMVLLGAPPLLGFLQRFAKLYSRVGTRFEFHPLSADEARRVVTQHAAFLGNTLTPDDLHDADGVSEILRIVKGNLRLMRQLLAQVNVVLRATRRHRPNETIVVTTALVQFALSGILTGHGS